MAKGIDLHDWPRPEALPSGRSAPRAGCYLVSYAGGTDIHYDGTLRIEKTRDKRIVASGDLYQHFLKNSHPPKAEYFPYMSPKFRYWSFLHVSECAFEGDYLLLTFVPYSLIGRRYRTDPEKSYWRKGELLSARLRRVRGKSGSHEGAVVGPRGESRGTLQLKWFSGWLRQARIDLNRTSDAKLPEELGSNSWEKVFERLSWKLVDFKGSEDLSETGVENRQWMEAELHDALKDRKRKVEALGAQGQAWRYYLLCVPKPGWTEANLLGLMFDSSATDDNRFPREGAAIFADHILTSEAWEDFKGHPFWEAATPYFRTAVHEIGHAMGLHHPDDIDDHGFMATTDALIDGKKLLNPPMEFGARESLYLRHGPDIFIHPGGVAFGELDPVEIRSTAPRDDVPSLKVSALAEKLPLGAPLRIHFKLTNRRKNPVLVPRELHLKSGHVRGEVIRIDGEGKPLGPPRTFTPLLLYCYAGEELERLPPGQSKVQDITLLRGRQGALAPQPGRYRVVVELSWRNGAKTVRVRDSTVIGVVADDESREAAEKILNTPSVLLALAIGRRYPSAERAITAAMNTKALRPHFDAIQAKYLGGPGRPLGEALRCLQKDSVITGSEYWHLKNLIKCAEADPEQSGILPGFREILDVCKESLPDSDLLEDD